MIVYSLDINADTSNDAFLYDFISQERLDRINKRYFNIDKKILLYTELLIKKVAAQYLNKNLSELMILKGDWGKPYIRGYENFCFSVSHTRHTIVIGVGKSPLGIDIERADSLIDFSRIAAYFSKYEQDYIKKSNDNEMIAILKIWTKKEAYVKTLGMGLLKRLDSFSVINDNRFITYVDGPSIISIFSFRSLSNEKITKINVGSSEIYDYYLSFQ